MALATPVVFCPDLAVPYRQSMSPRDSTSSQRYGHDRNSSGGEPRGVGSWPSTSALSVANQQASDHGSQHSVCSRGEFNGSSWLQGAGREARARPWYPPTLPQPKSPDFGGITRRAKFWRSRPPKSFSPLRAGGALTSERQDGNPGSDYSWPREAAVFAVSAENTVPLGGAQVKPCATSTSVDLKRLRE